MSNPDPQVTNLSLGIAPLGTFSATVSTWEMVSVVTTPSQGFSFSAGRWLVTLVIGGTGSTVPPSVVSQQDVTLASPGTITIPAQTFRHLRDFSSSRTVQVHVSVAKRVNTTWVPYASTGALNGIVAVPAAAVPASNALPAIGASNGQVTGSVAAFTVYPETYLDKTTTILKNAGMTITRTDPQWMHLCPSSRSFDPTVQAQYDAYFNALGAAGLKAIVFLCPIISSPAWAASGGTRGNPPANWTDYANFVSDFLTRWGSHIAAVECINEPNLNAAPNGYGTPTSAANYVTFLNHCYTAVKAYSASMPVFGGCIAYADATYLASLYATGSFRGNYDAISIHPYSIDFGATPYISHDPSIAGPDSTLKYQCIEGTSAIHELMRANGDGLVPIAITEVGFQTGNTGTNRAYSSYDVSEAQQAAYLAYTIRAFARLSYVSHVCVYAARDETLDRTSPFTYGIVDYWGNRAKPAVASLTSAITALNAGTG